MLASASQPCRAGAGNGGRRGVSEYGIAVADDPVNMAKAFRLAVEAACWHVSPDRAAAVILLMPPAADWISGGIGMKTFSDRWRQWTGTTSACVSTAKRLLT